jgi:hypothetical protein
MNSEGRCHAEASIELNLDPQTAWDVVMDWDRQSRWMVLTRVWATNQNGTGVGGGVAARTSVGPIGFTDDMVITHWDPPHECTVKHLGNLVQGTGTFTITPTSTTDSTGQPSSTPDSYTPDSSAPGSTAPGSTAPGSTVPGSTVPGSTASGSTVPGSTAVGSSGPAASTSPASSTTPASGGAAGPGAASGGCRFTWAEDVVQPLGRLGVLAWAVVRPGFEWFMRFSLRRLVREVAG